MNKVNHKNHNIKVFILGYICFGYIPENEVEKIFNEPNDDYRNKSISICTNNYGFFYEINKKNPVITIIPY